MESHVANETRLTPTLRPSVLDSVAAVEAYANVLAQGALFEDAEQAELSARDFMAQHNVDSLLQDSSSTVEETEAILQAIHAVDRVVESHKPFSWKLLGVVDSKRLAELGRRSDSVVHDILTDPITISGSMDLEAFSHLITIAESVVRERDGVLEAWQYHGRTMPSSSYARRMAESSHFPAAIGYARARQFEANSEVGSDESALERNAIDKLASLRRLEYHILNKMMGLPAPFVRDFRLSISERSLLQDKDGLTIPFSKGGGLNVDQWTSILWQLGYSVDKLGVDKLMNVYNHCGIVDFDNFSSSTIEKMDALVRGDPAVIATLSQQDIHICIKDTLGDYSNALGSLDSTLKRDEGDVLFFGIRRRSDLYRPFVLLAKHGLKPSTVFLGVHGDIGFMEAGLHDRTFRITASNQSTSAITSSSVARLYREYMQPSKQTGKREIVLISCLQASQEEGGGRIRTTPGALAAMANPEDRVEVVAGVDSLNVRKRPTSNIRRRGLEFWSSKTGRPVKTFAFSRQPNRLPLFLPARRRIGRRTVNYLTETK